MVAEVFDFRLLGYVRFAGCVQRSMYAWSVDVSSVQTVSPAPCARIVKAAQLLVRVQREERELSPVADSRRDGRVGWSKFGNPWLSDGRLVDWVI